MSTAVKALDSQQGWAPPVTEATWQAWVAKGRAHDRRGQAVCQRLANWIPIAALAFTVAFWSQVAPYDTVIRFLVAGGAAAVMFQVLHEKHYAVAAIFGAIALLYNPVFPVFDFSDGGPRVLSLASIIPFAASLTWGNFKEKQHD